MSRETILGRLFDNVADIAAAAADGQPERLASLAGDQRRLAQALRETASRPGSGVTRASVDELQRLIAGAMETVRGEMSQNRSDMHATGNRKRMLRAYGTVTVADTP